ncbi:MAG: hypothetical protein R2939_22555 [Kofleriaceae bacterium]
MIDQVARLAVVPADVDPVYVDAPMGCVRFAADGTVTSAKLKAPSAEPSVDAAFEAALAAFDEARDASPEPLPGDLRARLAKDPLCFRLRFEQ